MPVGRCEMDGAFGPVDLFKRSVKTLEILIAPPTLRTYPPPVKVNDKDPACVIDQDIVGIQIGMPASGLVEPSDALTDLPPTGVRQGPALQYLGERTGIRDFLHQDISPVEDRMLLDASRHGAGNRQSPLV